MSETNVNGVKDTSPTATSVPPSCEPDLVARVDEELCALDTLTFHELAQRFRETFHREPPIHDARWLRKKLVFAIQERAYVPLSDRAQVRLRDIQRTLGLTLERNGQVVRTQITRPMRHEELAAGTELRRVWHGKEERVLVRDGGKFEWQDKIFDTLTSVARAISGQAWSGPLFFGLRARSRKRRK